MLSDGGDLSCTDLYNVPHLGWADFSMTSIQATSRISDDHDGWRMRVDLESAGPKLSSSVLGSFAPLSMGPFCSESHCPHL